MSWTPSTRSIALFTRCTLRRGTDAITNGKCAVFACFLQPCCPGLFEAFVAVVSLLFVAVASCALPFCCFLCRYRRGRRALTRLQSRWKAFIMRRTYANVARQITVLQVCNVHIIFGLHCTPPATLPFSSLSFPWLCLQSSLRVYHCEGGRPCSVGSVLGVGTRACLSDATEARLPSRLSCALSSREPSSTFSAARCASCRCEHLQLVVCVCLLFCLGSMLARCGHCFFLYALSRQLATHSPVQCLTLCWNLAGWLCRGFSEAGWCEVSWRP